MVTVELENYWITELMFLRLPFDRLNKGHFDRLSAL